VKHSIKPAAYLRYGDDFIVVLNNLKELKVIRQKIVNFLQDNLYLNINKKNDFIVKAKWGLKFLGVEIFPMGSRLNKRNIERIKRRISRRNFASYAGLLKKHGDDKKIKLLNWTLVEKFFNE
jgi:hypothetical protein